MKNLRILLLTLVTIFPGFVFGQIIISEVMYDLSGTDTDREWVEIQNIGTEPVTITTGSGNGSWRFVDNSPHTLILFAGENILQPGQYAVIAKNSTQFMVDWPSFSGTLFTSAISFPNTTATLSIKDSAGNVLDTFSYNSDMGGKGDGNSLQKINTTFSPGTPTPGLVNSTEQVVSQNTTEDNNQSSTSNSTESNSSSNNANSAHSSPAPTNESKSKIDFEVYAGRDRLTTVGNNVVFKAEMLKTQGITEQSINFQWSFGDGSVGFNKTTTHAYRFPGEYNVVLNATYEDKQAVSRLVVRVVYPEIVIQKIEGGVEVYNKTKQEINLNDWTLQSLFRVFKFPTDTLLSSNQKVVFPDNVTGLSLGDVKLINPFGETLSSFGALSSIPSVATNENEDILKMEEEVLSLKAKIEDVLASSKKPIQEKVQKFSQPVLVETEVFAEGQSWPENNIIENESEIIFEAEKKTGFVNKMLALPILGLDFLFSIFE